MGAALSKNRAGITLMEVLISIGILSVGLASVVALIPAGGNEARRALIADRRGVLAANAMADAISRGVLNPAKWNNVPAAPYRVTVDPLGAAAFPFPPLPTTTPITLDGIAPGPAAEVVFRGEDDISYEQPADNNEPARPVYVAGQRVTAGAFSWLATLLPAGAGSNAYRLSIVVFHARQVPPSFPGPFSVPPPPPPPPPFTPSAAVEVTGLAMSTDDFRETFERGSPVLLESIAPLDVPVWRTIVLPMPQRGLGGAVNDAELLFDSEVPFPVSRIYVFPGAVGIVEKTVRLEGQSPWAL